jgi:hypothetical protein
VSGQVKRVPVKFCANMRGASPLTTILRSYFAGSCIVVRLLAGTLSGEQVIMPLDLICKNVTLTYVKPKGCFSPGHGVCSYLWKIMLCSLVIVTFDFPSGITF